MRLPPLPPRKAITEELRAALLPVAKRVFWWGNPNEWLNDERRFVAQVMALGDWDDTALASKLLGETIFQQVLQNPPPGVFDIKSWSYWHQRYQIDIPPLPTRKL